MWVVGPRGNIPRTSRMFSMLDLVVMRHGKLDAGSFSSFFLLYR